jgi:osmotically-inducible protein OsmY
MSENSSHIQSSQNKDEIILARIRELLRENPAIDDSKMEVEVSNGKVVLKGKADTEAEKENAQLICASVDGVIKVENHLVVEAGIVHALISIVSRIVADDKPDKKK